MSFQVKDRIADELAGAVEGRLAAAVGLDDFYLGSLRDVQRYCRDLEEALIRTLGTFELGAKRIEGLTGIWLTAPARKIASIGVHISKWVTTHGYALNVDLDVAPFTQWITACGLEDAAFTTMAAELGRSLTVDEVRPAAAAALEDVFDLAFDEVAAAA